MAQSHYAFAAGGEDDDAAVPEAKMEAGHGEHRDGRSDGGTGGGTGALADVSELPWFLRVGLGFSSVKHPIVYVAVSLATGGIGSFMLIYWMTKSYVIAGIIGAFQGLGGVVVTMVPDFSKGVFLELLLSDPKQTKKLASNVKSNVMGYLVFTFLVFFPFFLYFCVADLVLTSFLGPQTYALVVAMTCVSFAGLIVDSLFSIQLMMVPELGHVWETKILDYLGTVQSVLLAAQTTGSDATERLSVEQVVEKWAREVTKGTVSYNSSMLVFNLTFLTAMLGILASGMGGERSTGGIIIVSLFSLLLLMFIVFSLRSIAKPNMAWERAKTSLLNDAKVRRAVVHMGWSEQWNEWLHQHEINAARAFGVKVTMTGMRRAASALTSVFTVIMYFLLRQEVQNLFR
jgi:hypothetical protein